MNKAQLKAIRLFMIVTFLFVFSALVTEAVWGAVYSVQRNETYSILPTNKTYTFPLGLNIIGGGLTLGGFSITGILDVNATGEGNFATVNTGQGDYELYAMNQDVESSDAVAFASVDTGQGANELYDMNQNVQTTDNVNFGNVTATNFWGLANISTWWDGETSQADLNVNSSNYWDALGIPSDLNYLVLSYWENITNRWLYLSNFTDDLDYTTKNVNSSNYWDSLNTPSDITTMENFTANTVTVTKLIGATDFSTLYNVSAACPGGSAVTNLSYPVTCTSFAGTGTCGAGTVAQNTTTSGVQCVSVTESDPVYGANSYAVNMNQLVNTTASPIFSYLQLATLSDTMELRLDGSDSFINWSDGTLQLSSSETNTVVRIGKNEAGGSGTATLILQDDSGAYHTDLVQNDATLNIQPLDSSAYVVINDDSENNVDFRVESANETNMLLVDGDTNRVGIATNAPTTTLDVNGNVTVSGTMGLNLTGTGGGIYSSTGGRIMFNSTCTCLFSPITAIPVCACEP